MSIGRMDMIFRNENGTEIKITTVDTEYAIINIPPPIDRIKCLEFKNSEEFRNALHGVEIALGMFGFEFVEKNK